jgi:hypothetical protein
LFFYELDNTDNDKSIEVRLNDGAVPAKVINRVVLNNRFNSIKLYRSLPNRVVEPTRHLLKPSISDNKIVCITTSPSGSDAGIYCTKFICSLSDGRPKGPCIAGKVNYISKYINFFFFFNEEVAPKFLVLDPVKILAKFREIHWKQSDLRTLTERSIHMYPDC